MSGSADNSMSEAGESECAMLRCGTVMAEHQYIELQQPERRKPRTDDVSYAALRSLLCSGNRPPHRPSNCSGPPRACCLFKRVHLLLYAVIAFSLLFALPITVSLNESERSTVNRRWVTDIQCLLAGSSLLLLSDRSHIIASFDNNSHHSDE